MTHHPGKVATILGLDLWGFPAGINHRAATLYQLLGVAATILSLDPLGLPTGRNHATPLSLRAHALAGQK